MFSNLDSLFPPNNTFMLAASTALPVSLINTSTLAAVVGLEV